MKSLETIQINLTYTVNSLDKYNIKETIEQLKVIIKDLEGLKNGMAV